MKKIFFVLAAILILLSVIAAAFLMNTKSKLDSALVPPLNPGAIDLAELATRAPPFVKDPPDLLHHLDWNSLNNPPVSVRPWARWWWPGSDVEAAEIQRQLQVLADAGFGGVEIQAFKTGMSTVTDGNVIARVNEVGSARYYAVLSAAIDSAFELGLQVDLNHGSGWPAGGAQVGIDQSLQSFQFTEKRMHGPRSLSIDLPRPTPDFDDYLFALIERDMFKGQDFVNFAKGHERLLSVVAYPLLGGTRSRNPLRFNDQLILDGHSAQVLTNYVSDTRLRWEVPDGDWLILSNWILPVASAPVLVAGKHSGFVIDHLRSELIAGNYEFSFGEHTGLSRHYGKGLRGIFNDSLEFKVNRLARADILEQFRERRGYDLEPLLAALPRQGADNFYLLDVAGVRPLPEYSLGRFDDRIRHDYQQTVSDLVIEEFIITSSNWAEQRGLLSRGQSYGMDLDVLRGLGANSIPETEQLFAGGGEAGLKLPAAAAMLYGKHIVSAESFVWAQRSHGTTPRKAKVAADKLFISGVNHIIYHGVPYVWHGGERGTAFGEEGWFPFSAPDSEDMTFSSFISPNNPLWPGFVELNRYIARAQNLLRAGVQDVDVLIWYPFIGFPSSYGESAVAADEPLFQGNFPDAELAVKGGHGPLVGVFADGGTDHRVAWLESLLPVTRSIDRQGRTWSWLGSDALQQGLVEPGQLKRGSRYQLILLPNVASLSLADIKQLRHLQAQGQNIVLFGHMPDRVPGFFDAQSRDRLLQQNLEALLAEGALHIETEDQWSEQLAALDSGAVQVTSETAIRLLRRRSGTQDIRFFSNPLPKKQEAVLQLDRRIHHWWYDAVSGDLWPAETDGNETALSLDGFESLFLISGDRPAAASNKSICRASETSEVVVLDEWIVAELGNDLIDWRERPNVVSREAPLRYTARFTLNETEALSLDFSSLNLGLVHGIAEIRVNSRGFELSAVPPFRTNISAMLQAGENIIEIDLVPAMRNAMIAKGIAGDPHYAQMAKFDGQSQAAGLLGPVVLYGCNVSRNPINQGASRR